MPCSYPTVKLNTGRDFPILGLGTWKSKPGEVKQAVIDAIDAGYRHIDCAYAYLNQNEVGEGLKAKMTDGTVKREEIFVTSKVWNTFHSRDEVFKCLNETLKDLGLAYLDLFLIHWPMGYKEGADVFPKDSDGKFLYSDVDYLETWAALEEALQQGLVRAIGTSNFNSVQLERIIKNSTVVPATNQIECHPYLNQKKMIEFCKSKGIVVTAYSPLGSPDRPWAKPGEPGLMDDPKLIAIAEKYGKSPAQTLIRYQIQRDVVVIPKSVTKSRIIQNMQVFDFELSAEDMATIDSFDCDGRLCKIEWIADHKDYPFKDVEF